MESKNRHILYLVLTLIIGLLLGAYFSNALLKRLPVLNNNKFGAILNLISTKYVDSISVDNLTEKAIPLLIGGLDPHSIYIPASELQSVNDDLEGSFSGIGVQFNIMRDTISIVAVISGGPSEKVGLLPGDRIVKINDSTFVGKKVTNESVMKKLRGKDGSIVKLEIKRNTSKVLLPFKIERGEIPVNSVDVAYRVESTIGYIKISKFGEKTYDEFVSALAKLQSQKCSSFIIDLRGNPGGFYNIAVAMVNEFLPKDRLIVYTEGKTMPRSDEISDGAGSMQNNQIVVLIDEFSASSSEIFAGAIQDNDRGLIVGRRSYGKGLVQQQYPLADGSALRLTIARYYTPSGRCIQKDYQMGDSENYEQDIVKRYLHGEFDSQDSVKLNKKKTFKTLIGRKVYAGGGIMPDVFVPRDTFGTNSYYNSLTNSGAFYQFCFEYADRNRKTLSQFKTYKPMLEYLQNQDIVGELTDFAHEKGVRRRPIYIEMSRKLIETQAYALIARNMLGDDAFYPIYLQDDVTLRRAVAAIKNKEAQKLALKALSVAQ
ncbi:MAG: S41 family peptidase [Bacteroidales bacterium]|nr:S41 family peptidase [Bacteroidales bacterium]